MKNIKDFFGLPVKPGDRILWCMNGVFKTGTVLSYDITPTIGDLYAKSDTEDYDVALNNRSFIKINDIEKNNPQYFI